MKKQLITMITGALLLSSAITACRDDFEFDEFEKYDDSIAINGKVASPLINTRMKFSDVNTKSINERLNFSYDNSGLTHMVVNQDDKVINLPNMLSPAELAALGLPPQTWEKTYTTDKQSIFQDRAGGTFFIKNPTFTLNKKVMKNSTILLKINKIDFYNTSGTLLKTISPINDEFGESIVLNNENTNGGLSEALEMMPDYYVLQYTAKSDAIENGDKMKINVILDLPLEIKTDKFSIRDTMVIDIDDIIENADKLIIKTKVQNNIPVEIKLRANFLAQGVVIDSIYEQGPLVIDAATTDDDGKVLNTTATDRINTFDKMRITKLLNANCDKLSYEFVISSDQSKYVKITENQTLDLRMSMCVEAGFSTKD